MHLLIRFDFSKAAQAAKYKRMQSSYFRSRGYFTRRSSSMTTHRRSAAAHHVGLFLICAFLLVGYAAGGVGWGDRYNCNICGQGFEVTDFDAELVLPGQPTRTCQDLLDANKAGAIDEVSCSMLTMFTPETCGCVPVGGGVGGGRPTGAPTMMVSAFFDCKICGQDGLEVTNPGGEVFLPGQPTRTCQELLDANEAGAIDEISCDLLTMFTPILCECEPIDAPLGDIVDALARAGNFTSMIAALQAANLIEALTDSMGSYTIFAPLDSAFQALPEGVVDALLIPENSDWLTQVLLYHVVPGTFLTTNLTDGAILESLQGNNLSISISNMTATSSRTSVSISQATSPTTTTTGVIKVNDAAIVISDLMTLNGVVQGIDSVMLPPDFLEALPDIIASLYKPPSQAPTTLLDIVATATTNGNFTLLVAALGATDLVDFLSDPTMGPYTLFGPLDSAFEALPADMIEFLLLPENVDCLTDLLAHHIIPRYYLETNLTDGLALDTLEGSPLLISRVNGTGATSNETFVNVNEAMLVHPNIFASNGVIQGINDVLFPPQFCWSWNYTNSTNDDDDLDPEPDDPDQNDATADQIVFEDTSSSGSGGENASPIRSPTKAPAAVMPNKRPTELPSKSPRRLPTTKSPTRMPSFSGEEECEEASGDGRANGQCCEESNECVSQCCNKNGKGVCIDGGNGSQCLTSKPTASPTIGAAPAPTAPPSIKPTSKPTASPTIGPTPAATAQCEEASGDGRANGKCCEESNECVSQCCNKNGKGVCIDGGNSNQCLTSKPTASPTIGAAPAPTAPPSIKPTASPAIGPTPAPTAQCVDASGNGRANGQCCEESNECLSQCCNKNGKGVCIDGGNSDQCLTSKPTASPTIGAAPAPATAPPSIKPTSKPTASPTIGPTPAPTAPPSIKPTPAPTPLGSCIIPLRGFENRGALQSFCSKTEGDPALDGTKPNGANSQCTSNDDCCSCCCSDPAGNGNNNAQVCINGGNPGNPCLGEIVPTMSPTGTPPTRKPTPVPTGTTPTTRVPTRQPTGTPTKKPTGATTCSNDLDCPAGKCCNPGGNCNTCKRRRDLMFGGQQQQEESTTTTWEEGMSPAAGAPGNIVVDNVLRW